MEAMKSIFSTSHITTALVTILILQAMVARAQISMPCTTSMISSFSPCLNYITQGSNNASSPTSDCCNSLQSLTSASMDCACLIVTGSVPFRIPINRTMAISLPRACNMSKVTVQCKASVAPAPAPTGSFGPAPSPATTAPPTASTGDLKPPSASPGPDTSLGLSPASPPAVTSDGPTGVPGIRPVLTPNTAANMLSQKPLQFVLLFILGALLFN